MFPNRKFLLDPDSCDYCGFDIKYLPRYLKLTVIGMG